LRDKLELTQEQFAQKVGVTFTTVNNWEKGIRNPQPFLFKRLLEIAKEEGINNIGNIKRTKR
jgi:DNA-binding transcriptional regulator YiaG